jgi:acetyl-CoA synthase
MDARSPKRLCARLDVTAKEIYGIDGFTDMIADETICEEDTDALMAHLNKVGHPVLKMEPLM